MHRVGSSKRTDKAHNRTTKFCAVFHKLSWIKLLPKVGRCPIIAGYGWQVSNHSRVLLAALHATTVSEIQSPRCSSCYNTASFQCYHARLNIRVYAYFQFDHFPKLKIYF